jgi:bis(5'-nucleosidyl)-tetraphosphatase
VDDVRKRSAGVIVVRPVANEWRVLLLRAYRNWGFPKGRVDPGEESLAAAMRETAEEASLTDLEFRWGSGYCDTEPYAGGKVARYYVAASMGEEVSLPVNPELGRPEHHEFRWASFAQARSLLPPRLAPVLDWAQSLVAGGSGSRT